MTPTPNSNPLNPSNPPLQSHLFKPYIARQQFLSKFPKLMLCKRNYKYIHGFQADSSKPSFKIISKLKSLYSLSLSSSQRFTKALLLKKLLKPHKRSLRNLLGGLETPRFQRYLPLLARLTITNKPASWRLLISRSAFNKLIFDFDPIGSFLESLDQKAIQRLFLKYKAALCRNLLRMKGLSGLEIKSSGRNIELVLSMLEIINEKVNLESLKQLGLGLGVSVLQGNSQDYLLKPWKIDKALQFMTSLSIIDAERFSFLFETGKLKNLCNLNLRYFPKEEACDLRYLAGFKDLVQLKNLAFYFTAKSFACCETQFFENFIVPSNVENLQLDLANFTWNNQENFEKNPLYVQFFEKLQGSCQNIKILNLSITQGSHLKNCPALNGKFASLFSQRFLKLETMSFQNSRTGPLFPNPEEGLVEPLDLGFFWKALESSKETLISISINSQKIAFPEKIEALETRFPKLKNFTVKGNIICSIGLGEFCRSIPSLKEIIVQDLTILNEKNLKDLLFSWREIPREMSVNMNFNVEKIKQQQLIDCLMEYLQQMRVKGMLQMHFRNVQVQVKDIEVFQPLCDLTREKDCSESFSTRRNLDKKMFSISKNVNVTNTFTF